jgi:hypothetical protein
MTQEYLTCLEKSNGVTAEMINCILAETRRQDARGGRSNSSREFS